MVTGKKGRGGQGKKRKDFLSRPKEERESSQKKEGEKKEPV